MSFTDNHLLAALIYYSYSNLVGEGGISVAMQISSLTSPTLEPDASGMRPGQGCIDTDEKQSICKFKKKKKKTNVQSRLLAIH